MRVKSLLCVFFLLLMAGGVFAQVQTGSAYPKREFRAAWIQSVNGQFRGMPTEKLKQNLIGQLNSLQKAGINAIIFQVRPEADALYASRLEPWSRFLTGVQGKAPEPYWDPMQFMIDECHKRGMEFHAWINPYRTKTTLKSELAPNHVYNIHPEWFVTYGDQLYFDPALPESRRHICMVVSDIVSRYDVDAIHMDDYFYPYPIKGKDFPDDASFARFGGGFSNKGDWRRSNVNVLIKKLHETIREIKPWVKFGVSPFGIYRNESSDPLGSKTKGLQNYDDLYADVLLWAREGWIDYNIPQIYWEIGHPAADYITLIQWWNKNATREGTHLYIGQNVARTMKADQLTRKMLYERSLSKVKGNCFWPANEILWNNKGVADSLKQNYHRYPALIPAYTHLHNRAPQEVKKLKAEWTAQGYMLHWQAEQSKTNPELASYFVIYRFENKESVNLDDPSKIVAVTRETNYLLPYDDGKRKYRYVVTAVDRFHNENQGKSKKVKL